jgi:AcrR family transcriptional regulator
MNAKTKSANSSSGTLRAAERSEGIPTHSWTNFDTSVDFKSTLVYMGEMPRTARHAPRRARRSDFHRTRDRIVEAARREIGARGPDSVTLSAVAHAAGINRTTAYQHFRTRDELVRAVSEELIEELRAYLASQRPVVEHLDAIANYFLEHPELARLALYWLLSEGPIPSAGKDLFRQETRKAAEEGGSSDADPEMLGHLLLSMAVLWPLSVRIEFEGLEAQRAATTRLARELKRLLLYGVLRPEQWPRLVDDVQPRRNP